MGAADGKMVTIGGFLGNGQFYPLIHTPYYYDYIH